MIRAIFEVASPSPSIQIAEAAADVSYRNVRAQTGWVALGLDPEYVELKGQLSYVNLLGELKYTNLQAANVYADPTPPDRWVNDIQVTADSLAITFAKISADTVALLDAHVFATHKRVADTFSASAVSRLAFGKRASDSQSVSDQIQSLTVGKGLSDIQAIVDALQRSMALAKVDSVSANDIRQYSLSKPLQDSFSSEDSASLSFLAYKADSFSTSDFLFNDFSKLLSDVALADDRFSIEDELQQSIGKSLADSFNVSDAFSYTVNFNRSFSETEYVIDSQNLSFFKGLSDSKSTSDSGALRMTDYADISYFAEDYVGVSRTF
jgi:hypothetical protein